MVLPMRLLRLYIREIKEYLPNSEVRYAKCCDIIDKYFPESELYNVPLDTQERR